MEGRKTIFLYLLKLDGLKLQISDPTVHSWSQLANFRFPLLAKCNTNLCFNVDDKVESKEVNRLSRFYKNDCLVLMMYLKAN